MSFFEFPHTRTYDSDLGWLIKCCKSVNEAIDALNQWKDEVNPKIEDILKIWALLESGQLPPAIQDAIKQWLSVNALDLIGELVKTVFFEINDEGHFVAWIPDSWSDIIFNTTYYDIVLTAHPEIDFGHLVLTY